MFDLGGRLFDAGEAVFSGDRGTQRQGWQVGRHGDISGEAGGATVSVNVKGLTPGLHPVHVHAVGKCEGPAFTSAAGDFTPTQKKHGHKSAEGAHARDLPNRLVAQDGTGRCEVFTDAMTLQSGTRSLFDAAGSALIGHARYRRLRDRPGGKCRGQSCLRSDYAGAIVM